MGGSDAFAKKRGSLQVPPPPPSPLCPSSRLGRYRGRDSDRSGFVCVEGDSETQSEAEAVTEQDSREVRMETVTIPEQPLNRLLNSLNSFADALNHPITPK